MMAHTQPPEVLAKQARIMVDAGCQCVYVVDSAGALILEEVTDRVAARPSPRSARDAQVGFHGHENLGLGVGNSIMAARAGATQIDGSVRRFGAGAGNTPIEAFVGVCDKLGWTTGVDFLKIVDAAEDVVLPTMPEECTLNRMTLMMGYAGVYSSFLKHAVTARPTGTASPARRSCSRPGGASSSVARRTSSSTSPCTCATSSPARAEPPTASSFPGLPPVLVRWGNFRSMSTIAVTAGHDVPSMP